jgi:hypothetical protein
MQVVDENDARPSDLVSTGLDSSPMVSRTPYVLLRRLAVILARAHIAGALG